MSFFKKLDDIQLKKIIREKDNTIFSLYAQRELESRKDSKDFIRRDLVRWFALIISIISLILGLYNFTKI